MLSCIFSAYLTGLWRAAVLSPTGWAARETWVARPRRRAATRSSARTGRHVAREEPACPKPRFFLLLLLLFPRLFRQLCEKKRKEIPSRLITSTFFRAEKSGKSSFLFFFSPNSLSSPQNDEFSKKKNDPSALSPSRGCSSVSAVAPLFYRAASPDSLKQPPAGRRRGREWWWVGWMMGGGRSGRVGGGERRWWGGENRHSDQFTKTLKRLRVSDQHLLHYDE